MSKFTTEVGSSQEE